ncbi:MAG: DUF3899 domain-containing protein [Bacilli bacterium]|nr:DUF3899 domain-containing protein [Bacilli bacterium]
MEKFNKKIFIIGSLVTLVTTIVIAGLIFLFTHIGNRGNPNYTEIEIWVNAIDSLMISGFIGIVVYLFSILSNKGAFDIFSYSIKLVWYNTFHRSVRETALPKNYAEYKQIKSGKPVSSNIFLLVGSLPTFIAGAILMIPYYVMYI